jgi:uncharacterized protein
MMMSLRERISEDMKTAMRAKDADRLLTIRGLMAAIKQKEVDERIVLDEAQILAVVDKLIKQRRDSIAAFELAKRQDLVDKEKSELTVLATYMPAQMAAEEIAQEISSAVASTGASGPQDMGKVMAILKPKLAGKADLSAVSALVKAKLAG